jgi:DNA-binding NarL/FixJ family response regulator
MTIRVLLADDHPIATQGIALSLVDHPEIVVAGESRTLAETADMIDRLDPDVVLLDLRFPDGNATGLLARLKDRARPAIVVLSAYDTPQYVTAAMRLGAKGFLGKNATVTEITDAVRHVAEGRTYFHVQQVRVAQAAPLPDFTPREVDVLRHLLAGHSNHEIADLLGITEKTVEAKLSSIYRKTGGLSRTELVLRAERESWLESLEGTNER